MSCIFMFLLIGIMIMSLPKVINIHTLFTFALYFMSVHARHLYKIGKLIPN